MLALGGDPSTWDLATKKACNQIVEDAAAVALAHRAADIGTAVHRMTEMLDRGQPVDAGPYEADLEAYANALVAAGLTVVDVECRLVCDDLEMAGTADRILDASTTGHLVADIKTGETVDYGGLGWAAQLAAYAHRQLYDPDTGERTPHPGRSTRPSGSSSTSPPGRACARCTRSTSSPATGRRSWPTRSAPCAARRRGGGSPETARVAGVHARGGGISTGGTCQLCRCR